MKNRAYYHLPGLFEFYELYQVFLSLFREHREYFHGYSPRVKMKSYLATIYCDAYTAAIAPVTLNAT